MPDAPLPADAELGYYYFGLYAVLRRYRRMTILGWVIALLGLASIPLSWRAGSMHGIVDTMLSVGTIVAGLAVVQQSVTSLASYLHVPFRDRHPGTAPTHPALQYIEELIRDIDEGGWQDAYAGIQKLEKMPDTFGLPPPAPPPLPTV